MSTNTYSYRVIWSDEDAAFIASCPEFPGVTAVGGTPDEALQQASVALELAIEAYQADGWDLPAPASSPEFSGQFRLRLPRRLHAALAERAADEGVSLNSYCMTILAAGISTQDARRELRHCYGEMLSELRFDLRNDYMQLAIRSSASDISAYDTTNLTASSNQASGGSSWQS